MVGCGNDYGRPDPHGKGLRCDPGALLCQNMGGGTYKSNLLDNLEIIKEVGYKNVMVDTDGGQTENPHWELAIEEYMQYLLDHGIPEEQVYHMTHTIPAGLLGI